MIIKYNEFASSFLDWLKYWSMKFTNLAAKLELME